MAELKPTDKAPTEASSTQQPPRYGPGESVNSSGHVQELSRNFSLISLAGVGLVVGNVWPAIGGSILVALYNGGPPGKQTEDRNKDSV
jgi:choline transport protein